LRSSVPASPPPSRISGGPVIIILAFRFPAAWIASPCMAANLLVGNDPGAAVLEAVFMGPQIAFADDRMVAVAGAELPPKVDGEPLRDMERVFS